MSFSKNRKRSGVILAGVTTASLAASTASQGVVRALPQNNVVTSLAKVASGNSIKNAGSGIVNFLKKNYGWVILAVVCVGALAVWHHFRGNTSDIVKAANKIFTLEEKEKNAKLLNMRLLSVFSSFIDNNAFSLGLLGAKFKVNSSELEQWLTEHDTSLLKRYKDEIKFNEIVDSLEIKVVAFSGGSPSVRVRKVGEKAWSQYAFNFKNIGNNTNIADYINFLNLLFKRTGEQNKWEYILKFNYGGPIEKGIKLTLCKIEQKSGKAVKKSGLKDVFTKGKNLKNEDLVVVNQNREGIFEKVFFKDNSPILTGLSDKVCKELFNQEFYAKISSKVFTISKSELMNIVAPPEDLELESKDIEDILSSVKGETIRIKINKVDKTGRLNLYLFDDNNNFITSVKTLYATSDKSKIENFIKTLTFWNSDNNENIIGIAYKYDNINNKE